MSGEGPPAPAYPSEGIYSSLSVDKHLDYKGQITNTINAKKGILWSFSAIMCPPEIERLVCLA